LLVVDRKTIGDRLSCPLPLSGSLYLVYILLLLASVFFQRYLAIALPAGDSGVFPEGLLDFVEKKAAVLCGNGARKKVPRVTPPKRCNNVRICALGTLARRMQ